MENCADLKLNPKFRSELKKPLGKIEPFPEKQKAFFEKKTIISIGDRTTKNFLDMGIVPKLGIVDYLIERKSVAHKYLGFSKILKAKNPAGEITREAWRAVSKSLENGKFLLEIDGEEDLLVLPAILMANDGDIICYGQPGAGSVIVTASKESKKKASDLLKKCFSSSTRQS